jgi:hypothetical protein
MSLLYWLPLDNQTNNLGLKKLTWLAGDFYNGIGITTANCYKTIDNRSFNTPCVNLGLNFTICFWVKNTDLVYPRTCIAIKQSSGSPYSVGEANKGWDIGHGQNGNSVQVTLNDGVISQRLTITPPAGFGPLALLNTWYNASYVIDYDNKLVSYYVNGELMGTKAIFDSMGDYSTNKNFYFGNLYGWHFYGELNDFRIYDEALSAEEIRNIASGLFIHYDCQDQFPSTTLFDSSGYSRHALAEGNSMPSVVQDSGSGEMGLDFNAANKFVVVPQEVKAIKNGTLSYWWKSPSPITNTSFLSDGVCYLMKTTTEATTFSHKLSSGGSAITNLPIYVDGQLSNTVPSDNQWHYIVCTNIDLSSFGSEIKMGSELVGSISDIRFYNNVISADFIKNLYEAKAKITKGRKALAHYFVENNLADTSVKKTGSWNWSYFYEPKILEDGSKWKLLFYHKNHGGTVLFSNANGWAEAKKSATPDKFSILGDLDSTYQREGKFEFLLRFPNNTTFQNGFNRWKQSSNPTTNAVSGYEAIDISWTSNLWGGLEYNGNQALMDGSVNSSNWFYAIGARTAYGGAIPGPFGAVEETELWVRVDGTAHENDWGLDARNLTVEEIIEF